MLRSAQAEDCVLDPERLLVLRRVRGSVRASSGNCRRTFPSTAKCREARQTRVEVERQARAGSSVVVILLPHRHQSLDQCRLYMAAAGQVQVNPSQRTNTGHTSHLNLLLHSKIASLCSSIGFIPLTSSAWQTAKSSRRILRAAHCHALRTNKSRKESTTNHSSPAINPTGEHKTPS